MNFLEVLETIRCACMVAIVVTLSIIAIVWLYESYRDTVEDEVQEQLKKAVEEAAKPVVKVEISTKGRW